MSSTAFVIPAYQAESSVAEVVSGLDRAWREVAGDAPAPPILVVDDGSADDTRGEAERAGAEVLVHPHNRGKGAALLSGLHWARDRGIEVIVSVDADGQHPPEEAVRLLRLPAPREALVLGVRDLGRDGAPWPNRFSNGFSNVFLSGYCRMRLRDTQCGLRRYPVAGTLELAARDPGYAFEAEVILRTARQGRPLVQEPVRVVYPPEEERVTHFHSVRDPARIVRRVLWTVFTVPFRKSGGR